VVRLLQVKRQHLPTTRNRFRRAYSPYRLGSACQRWLIALLRWSFVLSLVTAVTGCATFGAATAAGLSGEDDPRAIRELPPLPDRITVHGISLDLPTGARVYDVLGGFPVDRGTPRGVLLRFTDRERVISGMVQIVPIPPRVQSGEVSFMDAFLEQFPRFEDSEILSVPVDGRRVDLVWSELDDDVALSESAAFGADESPELSESPLPRERVFRFAPLPPGISSEHGILIEIDLRRSEVIDTARYRDHLATAAAIGASLTLPATPDDLVWSQRIIGHESDDALAFAADDGLWSWAADTVHGFAVRRRVPGHDLYVLVDDWEAVDRPAPTASSGAAPAGDGAQAVSNGDEAATGALAVADETAPVILEVRLARGPWQYRVPFVPDEDGNDRRWTARIPSVDGGADLRVDVIEPGRAWRDGRQVGSDSPDAAALVAYLESLFAQHMRLGR
jgi:hypothetical protein